MATEEEAKKAIEMFDGRSFLGRELIVNKARHQRADKGRKL